MKKKFIFLTMMLLTFLGVNLNVLNAQETIEIGNGATANSGFIPFHTNYYHSLSQQIYTSDELSGIEGNITKFAIKNASTVNNATRTIDVYLINTDKSSFDSKEFIPITSEYLVFSGSVTLNTQHNWTEITLDEPFAYEKGKNVLLCINDKTHECVTSAKYYVYSTDDTPRALYKFADVANPYNPAGPPTPSGYMTYPNNAAEYANNQIIFTYESSGPAVMPSSVPEITSIEATHNHVTLAWNAVENAKKYNVYTSTGDLVATVSTTSCTIEDLEELTEYCYQVSAVNGELETENSTASCATTLEAPKTRDIVFTLIDSYGDGWNGAYLQVDATDGTNERLECPSGNSSISYTVRITEGETVYVTYVQNGNNWPEENTYCIRYDDGTEIYCSPTMDNTNARSYTFTVEISGPKVTVAASDYDIFSDEQTTLTATAANFDGDVTYSWSPAEGLSDATIANPVFTPTAAGTFTFTCTATDVNGNEASANVTINVTERPALALNVTADRTEIYQGQNTMLYASATGGFPYYSFNWFLNGEEYGTGEACYFAPTEVGTYTITCKVTDANNGTVEESVTINVLANPFAGRQFRVKVMQGTYAGQYLNINSHETPQPYGGWYSDAGTRVGVAEKNDSNTQIFTIEMYDSQRFYLRDLDGYLIKCDDNPNSSGRNTWDVDAYSTTVGTPLWFEYVDGEQFYIRDYDKYLGNGSSANYSTTNNYFKVENNGVYCDAPITYNNVSNSYITTWTLEEVLPSVENLVIVEGEKDQLYPGETTEISWDAFDGAVSYNVYVNGVEFASVTENTCELANLPYGMNDITVAAVFEDGSESGMSNSVNVQMTGTFNLTVNVKDVSGNPAAGAIVSLLGYDDYYQMAEYEFTTDENGQVVEDVLVLSLWNQYSITVSGVLYHKEGSETIYNDGSITAGASVEKTINLSLAGPTNVKATKDSYFVGDPITISWKGIETATRGLLGYNVYEGVYNYDTYQYDFIKLNEDALTETEYQVTESAVYGDLMYAVTALYDEGETDYEDYSSQVNIKVNGYGKITGVVTDGTNAIVGANVSVIGRDESWIEQSYTALTDAEGKFELEVLPSYPHDINEAYSVSVSKYGYESWASTTKYVVEYGKTTDVEGIVLTSYPEVAFDVTATNDNDNVTVTWDAPEGATQYNVFRKDATEEVVKLTETPITEQEYLATDWAELTNGTYQYGVSAFVGGGEGTVLNETFENGMPEGWTTEKNSESINSWEVKATDFTMINHTDGSYVYTTGTVTNGYSILKTTEYIIPNDAKLMFEYYSKPWGSDKDYLEIYAVNENNEEFLLITTNNNNAWTIEEVSLSQYAGQRIKLYFRGIIKWGYGIAVDNIKITGNNSFESSINWSNAVAKTSANVFTGIGNWNDAANWSNGVPANDANVFIEGDVTITSDIEINNITINENATVTIDADASLTVVNAITNKGGAANLIINDGAQLFQDNDNVLATFVMNVTAPNNWNDNMAKDGWQFVASPMTNASIADFLPEEGDYDFYKYDGYQDLEWRNIKADGWFETEFQQATGYLVSFENAASVRMEGIVNNESIFYLSNYDLNYSEEKPLANFNLVGNPFPFDMDWSKVELEDMAPGYAVVNNNGGYDYLTSGVIKAGDAFFVETNGINPTLYYDHKAVVEVNRAAETQSINLIATGNAGKDNVIINLNGKSEGFSKLQNLNDKIANIFVKDAGMRYGIFGFEPNTEEVEIAFDAKEIGSYTISAVPQGNFSSVILVDRVTGAETNLLTGSYTFMANSSEDHDRFVVRFSQDTAETSFVYQANEDLIINAEGTVQIIDVMGRIVYSNEVVGDNNRINVSNFGNAAYMVRVINEEGVKVQKVVIY